ncbi:MFS transporter [Gracilibacillus dipsosauri]|uniref:MFS transporter n=1 Tax=Gracilibacillus dipsosauri TaxID=178340 RepID=UPI00240A735D
MSNLKIPNWFLFTCLCTAHFMGLLDTSIVHIALPSIQVDLHASLNDLQWVVNAYTIFFGSFLILGGGLVDKFGRRWILLIGLLLFTIASAIGGLAHNSTILIGARVLQGLGAALIMPAVMVSVTSLYPEGENRNRALSVLGGVSALGFIIGLLAGGTLTEFLGWRWVFFINLPIGIMLFILFFLFLNKNKGKQEPIDFYGTITVSLGLVLFVYGLAGIGHDSKTVLAGWALMLAVFLFIVFYYLEHFIKYPLIPKSMFRNKQLIGTLIPGVVFGSVIGTVLYILTIYLQNIIGFNSFTTGLAFIPQELLVLLGASLVGRIVTKAGGKRVIIYGLVLFGVGLYLLSKISLESGYLFPVLPGTMIIGIGLACVVVAGSITVMSTVTPQERGIASGLWNTAPQIGASIGLASSTPVIYTQIPASMTLIESKQQNINVHLITGFQSVFFLMISFVIIGGIVFLALFRNAERRNIKPKKRIFKKKGIELE